MTDEGEITKAQAWAARSFCDPTTREIITGLVGSVATQAERVRVLTEALEKGLAGIDEARAACPVQSGKPMTAYCRKCHADRHQNCGPNVTAHDEFEKLARQALTPITASPVQEGEDG